MALQKHLLSKTIVSTQSYVSLETWTMNMQNIFPTVTNEWPFQDHLLSKAIISTQWTLSPGKPEQLLCRLKPSLVTPGNGLFKTIFQVNYCINLVSSSSWESWTMTMQCLFPSVTYEWPFQDHLLSLTLLISRDLSTDTLKATIQYLPCVDMRQLCQYICLIWTHCNLQCDKKHCCTYILHYCSYALIPLNKYVCHITHTCPTALLLQQPCTTHITAYMSKTTANCSF